MMLIFPSDGSWGVMIPSRAELPKHGSSFTRPLARKLSLTNPRDNQRNWLGIKQGQQGKSIAKTLIITPMKQNVNVWSSSSISLRMQRACSDIRIRNSALRIRRKNSQPGFRTAHKSQNLYRQRSRRSSGAGQSVRPVFSKPWKQRLILCVGVPCAARSPDFDMYFAIVHHVRDSPP